MDSLGPDALRLIEIVWVNVVLSGDNAVVIALACRGLPPERQRLGLILGSGVAIVLRLVFTAIVVTLLTTPYLKLVGGVLLLWVGIKLAAGEDEDEARIPGTDRLWRAVRTIAVADAVMSLDNVLAIAAVAKGSTTLLIIGLAISIPLIVVGASLIVKILERYPFLVWAGAALLGWIAGEMMASDPAVVGWLGEAKAHATEIPAGIAAAILVLGVGYLLSRRGTGPPMREGGSGPPVFDAAFRSRLLDLFRWRRDVRRFRPDPLPDGTLERLVAIACLAPSVGLSEPWRFVSVESPAARAAIRAAFAHANAEALAAEPAGRAALYARLKLAGLDAAPLQLAVFADRATQQGHGLGRRTMPETLDYSAVLAIHTLWLAARAEGLGIGWVSILDPEDVARALDVPPAWRLIGHLCIGVPEEESKRPELERAGWENRCDPASVLLRR